MIFRFCTHAALSSAVVAASTAVKRTKDGAADDPFMDGALDSFVPHKIAFDGVLPNDNAGDKGIEESLRPMLVSKKEEERVKTLRNYFDDGTDETDEDQSPATGRDATTTAEFDASDELGILDPGWNTSAVAATTTIHRRRLDNDLECDEQPSIPADVDFAQLVYTCLYEETCPYEAPLGCWKTSQVTDMSGAFRGMGSFNEDISGWNTRRVNNMNKMFEGAESFNQPIGYWNTKKVKKMKDMFFLATSFNQPLNYWNVAKVKTMESMFYKSFAFNQPLDSWQVSSVTTMNSMFSSAYKFNSPIFTVLSEQPLDTTKMFLLATEFNQPVDSWQTSSITNTRFMFNAARAFNQEVNSWDVSSVEIMQGMFSAASSFNQDVGSWDVSNVGKMSYMFYSAEEFNQPLDGWDVNSATTMLRMFNGAAAFNQCLSTWYEKVPDSVSTNNMFVDSGCPNRGSRESGSGVVPNPDGAWCQGGYNNPTSFVIGMGEISCEDVAGLNNKKKEKKCANSKIVKNCPGVCFPCYSV